MVTALADNTDSEQSHEPVPKHGLAPQFPPLGHSHSCPYSSHPSKICPLYPTNPLVLLDLPLLFCLQFVSTLPRDPLHLDLSETELPEQGSWITLGPTPQ